MQTKPRYKFIGPRQPTGTRIYYHYCDYSNWRFYGEFTLHGRLSFNEIEPYLYEGRYFVPREVKVKSLTPRKMNEDDHWLHEIVEMKIAVPKRPVLTSVQFVRRLKECHEIGWHNLCPWF